MDSLIAVLREYCRETRVENGNQLGGDSNSRGEIFEKSNKSNKVVTMKIVRSVFILIVF